MYCGNRGYTFEMGISSGRYQKYYAGAYVHGRDDNGDTPYVEIGRCRMVSGAR
jgi:hypothetical protein